MYKKVDTKLIVFRTFRLQMSLLECMHRQIYLFRPRILTINEPFSAGEYILLSPQVHFVQSTSHTSCVHHLSLTIIGG